MASILKPGAFRVAVIFAITVTITSYVLFALVYLQFYASNVLLVRSVLQDEVRGAVSVPMERLKARLDLRLTQDLRHLDYVGLYKDGQPSFGNVPADLDVAALGDGTAHQVRTPSPQHGAWESENAIFVAKRRPDGTILVLGRSLVYVDRLKSAMLQGFVAAIMPVALLALLVGFILDLRASRWMTRTQEAINRVMGGDLYVRLPQRQGSGNIDALVRSVNQMLDEIVRLLNQNKSVGDNIAHDLRAPLAVMRARLERGLAGTSEDALRALTVEALGDLERAMTTVTALLRISELESGLRRGAFDAVDLAFVCRDAFDLYEPLAEAKGLKMSIEAALPVRVSGDGDLLREAVANLIDNAVKYTPAGGAIAVTCGGSGTLIRVADTGPGIAAEEREKITKRFYRAKATSDVPGVGLGLSLAATIFELHGFRLAIQDNAPGAIFEITAATPA